MMSLTLFLIEVHRCIDCHQTNLDAFQEIYKLKVRN